MEAGIKGGTNPEIAYLELEKLGYNRMDAVLHM